MEVRQPRLTYVVDSIVRLHNFCRGRNIEVPDGDEGEVLRPSGVEFTPDGRITGEYFATDGGASGRPSNNQAGLSAQRESIRSRLEIAGVVRPAHNVARNKS